MNYEQEQQFAAEVKRYVTEHLPLSQISDSELQQQIEDIVEQRIGAGYCSIEQRVSIVEQVYSSIRGFGLLDSIIKDDTITEVMIDDINSFAETFAVCNRLGGNLKKVVVDSRDIISDKIEIEMEIQTTVAANKNEINIMCVMPFVIIAMMGTMGQASITANTPLNVLVKLIAIFMFVIAYKLGRKITDIKV